MLSKESYSLVQLLCPLSLDVHCWCLPSPTIVTSYQSCSFVW